MLENQPLLPRYKTKYTNRRGFPVCFSEKITDSHKNRKTETTMENTCQVPPEIRDCNELNQK